MNHELGREWRQEAIFRVVNGEVALVSCETPGEEYPLRSWVEMVDDA